MTDRELLEAAASAAGMGYLNCTPGAEPIVTWPPRANQACWHPLSDDGDALRLAVKLRIKFRYNEALGQALAWTAGAGEMGDFRVNIEECGRDECACTRRAIVSAAASMAKPTACECERCKPNDVFADPPVMRMILCAQCGNKRCPHATDHRNACTGSNDVGQKGSSWEHVKPFRAAAKVETPVTPEPSQFTEVSNAVEKDLTLYRKMMTEQKHPDDVAVDTFAEQMKAKLAEAREKGRGGWQGCPPEKLSQMLRDHVDKGDPIDVANFAMFLWSMKATISSGQVRVKQDDTSAEWRRLALQFDGHRMQAMAIIKHSIKELIDAGNHSQLLDTLTTFNAARPPSGEAELAKRIAALAPSTPVKESKDDLIEEMCARIEAADSAAAHSDYMLDSNDCISVLRGTWEGLLAADYPKQAPGSTEVEQTEVEHWAELHRLRDEVKGPDGYATWKDAAVAERIRRVKAESLIASLTAADNSWLDTLTTYAPAPNTPLANMIIGGKYVRLAAVREALKAAVKEQT